MGRQDNGNAQRSEGISPMSAAQPAIDADTEAALAKVLRAAFAAVIDEPLPQRFMALLDKLASDGVAPPPGHRTRMER